MLKRIHVRKWHLAAVTIAALALTGNTAIASELSQITSDLIQVPSMRHTDRSGLAFVGPFFKPKPEDVCVCLWIAGQANRSFTMASLIDRAPR